jgi:hypothetical protein
MDFGLLGIIGYYLLLFAGSVSFGYLTLRLTFPDVRIFDRNRKLTYSLALGVGITFLAILADAALGLDAALTATGFVTILLFFSATLAVVLLKIFFHFNKQAFVTVAVPIPTPKPPSLDNSTVKKTAEELGIKAEELKMPEISSIEVKQKEKPRKGIMASILGGEKKQSKEDELISKAAEKKELDEEVLKPISITISEKRSEEKEVKEDEKTAKKIIAEAKQTEFDLMTKDLFGEGEGNSDRKAQASTSGRRHRLYEHGGKQVSVIAPKGTVDNEAFTELMNDVYTQLKQEGKVEEKKTPAAAAQGTQPKKSSSEVSMGDLFGEGERGTAAKTESTTALPQEESNPLFAQLGEISSGKPSAPAKATEPEKKMQEVKIPAEKGMGCPNCRAKNSKIIFCPYCGSGMCANCSPKIVPGKEAFVYTCPKCQEEVTVKKK